MRGTGSALWVQLWSEESGWGPPGWYSSVPSGAAHVSWLIPSCGACTMLLSPWLSITVIFPICIISPIALSYNYHSCWRIRGSPSQAFALRAFHLSTLGPDLPSEEWYENLVLLIQLLISTIYWFVKGYMYMMPKSQWIHILLSKACFYSIWMYLLHRVSELLDRLGLFDSPAHFL